MDWTDFFQGITQAGTSIATAIEGPRTPVALPGSPGAYYVPPNAGGQIVQSSGGLLGGGSNSILILLLLGVALIFAVRR